MMSYLECLWLEKTGVCVCLILQFYKILLECITGVIAFICALFWMLHFFLCVEIPKGECQHLEIIKNSHLGPSPNLAHSYNSLLQFETPVGL